MLGTLTDDITRVSGKVGMAGSVAYVAQTAFVLNDTVRSNILFAKEMREADYRRAVRVSQLEADLAVLPSGDNTEIGERGVTLSGGQKQRVSIARAVYADADVYLLDDPLSAVDSHVGAALFSECINGALKRKTRVLVTNALQHLPQADHIVVMSGGAIAVRANVAWSRVGADDDIQDREV